MSQGILLFSPNFYFRLIKWGSSLIMKEQLPLVDKLQPAQHDMCNVCVTHKESLHHDWQRLCRWSVSIGCKEKEDYLNRMLRGSPWPSGKVLARELRAWSRPQWSRPRCGTSRRPHEWSSALPDPEPGWASCWPWWCRSLAARDHCRPMHIPERYTTPSLDHVWVGVQWKKASDEHMCWTNVEVHNSTQQD